MYILSMADMICLDCMQKTGVHEQCWVCMVYVECNVCCEIVLLLKMADMDQWKTVE